MLHGHHMKKRLSKNKSDIYFVYPGNINAKTGGYIYEKNILEYAKIRDINIRPIALSENYPFPTNNDIKYFLKILDKIDPDSKIIIDGLALEGMYSIFKKILTYNVIALIHHPLYLEIHKSCHNLMSKIWPQDKIKEVLILILHLLMSNLILIHN